MEPKFKNADPDKVFRLSNGKNLSNVKDLYVKLKDMDELEFSQFCNDEKNDFYNWVVDVLNDQKLASELAGVKNKHETQNILKKHVSGVYINSKRKSLEASLPISPPLNPLINYPQPAKVIPPPRPTLYKPNEFKEISNSLPNPDFLSKAQNLRHEKRFKRAKAQEVNTILKQLNEVYDIGL